MTGAKPEGRAMNVPNEARSTRRKELPEYWLLAAVAIALAVSGGMMLGVIPVPV
jgi:hypothetical protein